MTTLNIRTIDKQTITLSGSSMTTVADVARLLEEQHQFEINCQQLMLCGRVLSEEEKIEHLQLTKKSFLCLTNENHRPLYRNKKHYHNNGQK